MVAETSRKKNDTGGNELVSGVRAPLCLPTSSRKYSSEREGLEDEGEREGDRAVVVVVKRGDGEQREEQEKERSMDDGGEVRYERGRRGEER